MKKKIFIVQMLDSKNPSGKSFTQVNDALFYSNDTDAHLVFLPHEQEMFEFNEATVALYNIDDGSLVERPAVIETFEGRKSVVLKMTEDLLAHWGRWQAQVVFKQGDKINTSVVVKFDTLRYMLDQRPPTLRDVIKVDELYSQLVTVMEEIAGKDVISAPEIILARGGENTLGERLDKEHNEVTAQLAEKAQQADLELEKARIDNVNSEVVLARGGKPTLGARLDETNQKIDDIHINIKDYGAKSGDDITDILISLIEEEVAIFIPKGDYIFSRPIKTRKRVRIKGFDSKHTTLRYRPEIDDGTTALEVMSLNWDSEILTIENIYLRDESNETNTFISVGHSDDGKNLTWGARVRVENSAIRNYKNIGLHVVAPYNNLISNSTFRGKAVSESLPSTLTPVTNGVGIYFTGSGGNIQTFGNVNRIIDTNFGDNIYGVELENIQSTYFDNCTFENNWISAYLHSDDSTDKYKSTSRSLFTNCWFEDNKNGHPDLYIVDCKMDKVTGQYDTTKEVALSTTSINSNFVYKNMGLPASKGFNMDGTHWSTDNPDQYLFRQWDRKWELGGGGKTDGVVTKIGGKDPYFRGVLGLNKGIEYHSASIASSKPANKITENVEIFDIRMVNAIDNVFEYSIDLTKMTQPELFNENYISTLRSKITIVVRSYDWNKAIIETDCLFYGMTGGGESRDSYKTVFPPDNQLNLKKVDSSVTGDNNNMGLRIVRSGSTLTLKFHIAGFKGGTVYMENKYLTNMNTGLF